MTAADRMRRYRQRRKELGFPVKGGAKGDYDGSKWKNAQFIALDGEGASVGQAEKFSAGDGEKIYEAKDHYYTLLAASTGESLYSGGRRLKSQDCIDFLIDLGIQHVQAYFVIFAGSYDINHMLLFGFDRDFLRDISRGEIREYDHEGKRYRIEYRARKSLSLKRGLSWKTNAKGEMKPHWADSITIWDVFGFFQENFVGVMKKWLGEKHKHFELIKTMKQLRGDFSTIAQDKINAYNRAELECLVEIMNKVRDAVDGLDLKLKRWDGAGSIAAALMQKHNIKEFKRITDDAILNAVRSAYAGGRIEVCKIGNHQGAIYDYDINSAYPSVMQHLPCMLHGHWKHKKGFPQQDCFSIVHCKFNFPDGMPFYPLFYRTEKMQISFPSSGEGYYWYPEFAAAVDQYGDYITAIEYWEYIQECNHRPFHWIGQYYDTRQQWIKNPLEEWQRGAEKIIKLGLNSLYGKSAQQLGAREGKPPAYHQMEWAGYITSTVRARLYLAAMENPSAIIGFATDGLFTVEKLDLRLSRTKAIGEWELKEPVPLGMTIAMAGVYWWHDKDGGFTHYSRGFDKDSMKTPDRIIDAWKRGLPEIDIPMHRLIGMGTACASDVFWKYRGRFTEGERTLRLDGKSHKRQSINVIRAKPHLKLVNLKPSINQEYESGLQDASFPYPLKWLGDDFSDDYQSDLEMIKEMGDTDDI